MSKKRKPNVQRVSLLYELDLVRKAIVAASMLADCLASDQFESRVQERQAPHVIGAVLNVVDLRLALTLAVLRGDADASVLWCAANDAGEPSGDDGVVLVSRK